MLNTWYKPDFDKRGFWSDHPRMEFFTCILNGRCRCSAGTLEKRYKVRYLVRK